MRLKFLSDEKRRPDQFTVSFHVFVELDTIYTLAHILYTYSNLGCDNNNKATVMESTYTQNEIFPYKIFTFIRRNNGRDL